MGKERFTRYKRNLKEKAQPDSAADVSVCIDYS